MSAVTALARDVGAPSASQAQCEHSLARRDGPSLSNNCRPKRIMRSCRTLPSGPHLKWWGNAPALVQRHKHRKSRCHRNSVSTLQTPEKCRDASSPCGYPVLASHSPRPDPCGPAPRKLPQMARSGHWRVFVGLVFSEESVWHYVRRAEIRRCPVGRLPVNSRPMKS